MTSIDEFDVVIVGGGISGLTAAWRIARGAPDGTRIALLERSDYLGGKINVARMAGIEVDRGPDAFLARRPEAVQLCEELGLSSELVEPGQKGAYVWARGKLRRLPDGLVLGIPTRILPLAKSGIVGPTGTLRAALDLAPRRRRSSGEEYAAGSPSSSPSEWDMAVGPLVRRHLGRQVVARLTDPLVG